MVDNEDKFLVPEYSDDAIDPVGGKIVPLVGDKVLSAFSGKQGEVTSVGDFINVTYADGTMENNLIKVKFWPQWLSVIKPQFYPLSDLAILLGEQERAAAEEQRQR